MVKISLCLFIVGLVLPTTFGQGVKVVIQDLGCWNENSEDYVFEIREGEYEILDGPHSLREDPLQKCAKVAQELGYEMFALREGGLCSTGPMAGRNFTRHGPSTECEFDGRGGIKANQVYLVNKIIDAKYVPIGNYSIEIKGLELLEGRFVRLMDDYEIRQEPAKKCARAAATLGFYIFGIVDGACYILNNTIENLKYYPREPLKKQISLYHLTYLSNVTIVNMGCYKTNPLDQVLPLLESRSDILGELDYKMRPDAIEKCAIYIADWGKEKNHNIFGITDGGACAAALSPWYRYDELGPSDECPIDGRGSSEAVQAYKYIKEYRNISIELQEPFEPVYLTHLGCWKYNLDDQLDFSVLPTLEGTDPILYGYPREREDPVQLCAKAAHRRGFKLFALIEGGCYSSHNAHELFKIFGPVEECDEEFGSEYAMSVYEVGVVRDPWITNEGCYEDRDKVLVSLEGVMPLISDPPKARKLPVLKCSQVASILNYTYFALLDGGHCHGLQEEMFHHCTPSAACSDNGEGVESAAQVYKLKEVNNFTLENLGCWKDDAFRTIPLAEGSSIPLMGRYTRREDAIGDCARYARSRGFKVFALQAGGMCMTSERAEDTYNLHGWSSKCAGDGKGGEWANQVYKINEDWWNSPVEWWKVPEPWNEFGAWNCTWNWFKTPEAPFL